MRMGNKSLQRRTVSSTKVLSPGARVHLWIPHMPITVSQLKGEMSNE